MTDPFAKSTEYSVFVGHFATHTVSLVCASVMKDLTLNVKGKLTLEHIESIWIRNSIIDL